MKLKRESLRILLAICVAGILIALGFVTFEATLRIWVVVGTFTLLVGYVSKNAPDKLNLVYVLVTLALVVFLFIWLIPKVIGIGDYRAVIAGIGILIAFIIPVVLYFLLNRKRDSL